MIVITLEGDSSDLIDALFTDARLLDRIAEENTKHLDAIKANPSAPRRSYIGFTTVIAERIENVANNNSQIAALCKKSGAWQAHLKGPLAHIREVQSKPLGGTKPIEFPAESSDEEEDGDSIFSRYRLGFSENLEDDLDDDDDEDEDLEGENFRSSDEFDEHSEFSTDRNLDDLDSEESSDIQDEDLLSDSDEELSSEEGGNSESDD